MSQKDLTSILAVDELLQRKPTIPNEAVKYAQDGSGRSEPLPEMTSQSVPWTHKPEDLTIRNAVASCKGINNIGCRISYGRQILSAREILGFASQYKRPMPEFISSLQVVGEATRSRESKDFAAILLQAHQHKERLKVYWEDRLMAFEEVIAEGQTSLVLAFLWRKRHFIAQGLLRWLYRELVMPVFYKLLMGCYLAIVSGTCFLIFLGTCTNILAYLGNI
jgi:hypothetical protein